MRPDTHEADAPVLERIEILIAWRRGAEGVEEADAEQKNLPAVDLEALAGNANGRADFSRPDRESEER